MRKYENFFMVQPDLSEDALGAVAGKFRGVVESNGGTVVSYVPWGKKKLAYPVKKNDYGYYILMKFAAGPELIAELERNMRLDERVLKFITVKLDDDYLPEQNGTEADVVPSDEAQPGLAVREDEDEDDVELEDEED
ncbi:MAG: 30S ribosomal protein S6 [Syntrophobacteraceae bacterium CG2_30_61_12]|nr:MAG: 30S ribosomal protein S6 [Syntrophobacteraceae bacterium CG2_30_61_12]